MCVCAGTRILHVKKKVCMFDLLVQHISYSGLNRSRIFSKPNAQRCDIGVCVCVCHPIPLDSPPSGHHHTHVTPAWHGFNLLVSSTVGDTCCAQGFKAPTPVFPLLPATHHPDTLMRHCPPHHYYHYLFSSSLLSLSSFLFVFFVPS